MERANETSGERLLTTLREQGVSYLYSNSGTDTAPLVKAWADRPESHQSFVTPVLAAHENLAIGMAHGHTLATGEAQAVLVHVSVGTANLVCGLMNAARDNVPMLVIAGRTPLTEAGQLGARNGHIHWAQEMYDQAGIVREFVKWDYELKAGQDIGEAVSRALAIARSEPQGPVYLTLPREVLAAPAVPAAQNVACVPASAAQPADADVERVRDAIAKADFPVIITTNYSRGEAAVSALGELADEAGIGVVEFISRTVAVPAGHPMHLGYKPPPALEQADLVLVLESDVPWIPDLAAPRPDARIIHIGADPLFSRYPWRQYRTDMAINADAGAFVTKLRDAFRSGEAGDSTARRARIGELATTLREQRKALAQEAKDAGGITKAFANLCLKNALPANGTIVDEYWSNRSLLDLSDPDSYYLHSPAAGLGWGVPAAIGIAQARRDRLVVATVGDGAFMFANPVVCHQAAQALNLPLITMVYNNSRWDAVEMSTRGVYDRVGEAGRDWGTPFSRMEVSPDFAGIARACGCEAETVEQKEELEAAMRRSFDLAAKGRQVLLEIRGSD